MQRFTVKRANNRGYCTQFNKPEIVHQLGLYEDTGLTPEEIKNMVQQLNEEEFEKYLERVKEDVERYKKDGLGYVSITCQLTQDITRGDGGRTFAAGQLKQLFDLAKGV